VQRRGRHRVRAVACAYPGAVPGALRACKCSLSFLTHVLCAVVFLSLHLVPDLLPTRPRKGFLSSVLCARVPSVAPCIVVVPSLLAWPPSMCASMSCIGAVCGSCLLALLAMSPAHASSTPMNSVSVRRACRCGCHLCTDVHVGARAYSSVSWCGPRNPGRVCRIPLREPSAWAPHPCDCCRDRGEARRLVPLDPVALVAPPCPVIIPSCDFAWHMLLEDILGEATLCTQVLCAGTWVEYVWRQPCRAQASRFQRTHMADMTDSPRTPPGEGGRRDVGEGEQGGSLSRRHSRFVMWFRPQWQVFIGDSWGLTDVTWTDAGAEFARQLEVGFWDRTARQMQCTRGTRTYLVDFADMTITNLSSLQVRAIRRLLVPVKWSPSVSESMALSTPTTENGLLWTAGSEPSAQGGTPSPTAGQEMSGPAGHRDV